jgi:hypothetical protein
MSYKYEDVLDANQSGWLAQLKALIDKGKQVAVVHIQPNQMRDCYAYAQEHDFTCAVEDNDFNPQDYPEVQPKTLGFVHRDRAKRILW